MRLLYITLLLCALSITVHSAADHHSIHGEVLGNLVEKALDTCKDQSEDNVQCVQRELELIGHFSSLSLFFIKQCSCLKCIETNLHRAAFDLYLMVTVVEPCGWFEHEDADEDKQLYDCIVGKVDNLDWAKIGSIIGKINATKELESMDKHFGDCKADENHGKDLVACVEDKYETERPKPGEDACQSNEDRKLYKTLSALLKRFQN